MDVAQKGKETEITEQDSHLIRNLLGIAIYNISDNDIWGLFPEKYFNDECVRALDVKIKKLIPMDGESCRLIDWMEKGVYDATQKQYVKTFLFRVYEAVVPGCDSQEFVLNLNDSGSKKQGGIFKCNTAEEITPDQMRSSDCKVVRTLMKLLYYDHLTPADYEPPLFRGSTEEAAHNPWTKSPLTMVVGNVKNRHFVLAFKVKSVLDPCKDENEDILNDGVSLGDDSVQRDNSDSGSQASRDWLPGKQLFHELPNHLSADIIARVPYNCHRQVGGVSKG